jgi:hypothetical protein
MDLVYVEHFALVCLHFLLVLHPCLLHVMRPRLVNVSGLDIVDGSSKLALALLWQVCTLND